MTFQGYYQGSSGTGGVFPEGSEYPNAFAATWHNGPYRCDTNPYTSKAGANETAPKNIAVLPLIVAK